jgi:hypothetical protein
MKTLQEILGNVNYWLDRDGKAFVVSSHIEWACRLLKQRVPEYNEDERVRDIYWRMFNSGWVRVSISPAGLGRQITVEYFRITRPQLDWLQEEAVTRRLRVVDNDGKELFDFEEPDVAESVVDRLLAYHI